MTKLHEGIDIANREPDWDEVCRDADDAAWFVEIVHIMLRMNADND